MIEIRSETQEPTGTHDIELGVRTIEALNETFYQEVKKFVRETLHQPQASVEFLEDSRFVYNTKLVKVIDEQGVTHYLVVKHADTTNFESQARWKREAEGCLELSGLEAFPKVLGAKHLPEINKGFMVLEYFDGMRLDAWAKMMGGESGIPIQDLASVAIRLAKTIAICHRKKWPHGDLSLSNALISPRKVGGEYPVTLLDIGNSPRVVEAGETLYSTPYYAPERVMGWGNGYVDDVFSFGMFLRNLFSKKNTFVFQVTTKDGNNEILDIFKDEKKPPKVKYREFCTNVMTAKYDVFALLPLKLDDLESKDITQEQLKGLNDLIAKMTLFSESRNITMTEVVEQLQTLFTLPVAN